MADSGRGPRLLVLRLCRYFETDPPDVKQTEAGLLIAIASRDFNMDGRIVISDTLAACGARVGPRAAQRVLPELERKGWIKTLGHTPRGTLYQFNTARLDAIRADELRDDRTPIDDREATLDHDPRSDGLPVPHPIDDRSPPDRRSRVQRSTIGGSAIDDRMEKEEEEEERRGEERPSPSSFRSLVIDAYEASYPADLTPTQEALSRDLGTDLSTFEELVRGWASKSGAPLPLILEELCAAAHAYEHDRKRAALSIRYLADRATRLAPAVSKRIEKRLKLARESASTTEAPASTRGVSLDESRAALENIFARIGGAPSHDSTDGATAAARVIAWGNENGSHGALTPESQAHEEAGASLMNTHKVASTARDHQRGDNA